MGKEIDAISDDELLYRRIPFRSDYFDPDVDPRPSPKAFRPRERDRTGLSVVRAELASPEEAVRTDRGAPYYLAVLRAGDLREAGLVVEPRFLPDIPGHAEITSLTYENRASDASEAIQVRLAESLCLKVIGPVKPDP